MKRKKGKSFMIPSTNAKKGIKTQHTAMWPGQVGDNHRAALHHVSKWIELGKRNNKGNPDPERQTKYIFTYKWININFLKKEL